MARGALLVAVAVACIVAVLNISEVGAAIVRAIDDATGYGIPNATASAPGPSPGVAGAGNEPPFTGGTCVTYPATGPAAGQSVFVDAGHGGPDPGAIGEVGDTAVMEKVVTLAVARRLAGLLENDGYRVTMSRTGDSAVAAGLAAGGELTPDEIHRDLLARIACANKSGANLLVSIHFNGSDDSGIAGSETFYDAERPFAASNRRLAVDLQRSITAAVATTDLGVWPDDQNIGPALTPAGAAYGHLVVLGPPSPGYVDTPSQMPGSLVEPLFLTNPAEAQRASDPRTQQQLAVAIDAGVRAYFRGA
ncbi:MAG TPA: N-acetylmuramoyl-L-alanine amidase [Candidatus Dormibacteraeota bacterium]|nr:N-acetylmuramoyl-L-alanine amidase [Candidatus Dormibacteraeota bacterium]